MASYNVEMQMLNDVGTYDTILPKCAWDESIPNLDNIIATPQYYNNKPVYWQHNYTFTFLLSTTLRTYTVTKTAVQLQISTSWENISLDANKTAFYEPYGMIIQVQSSTGSVFFSDTSNFVKENTAQVIRTDNVLFLKGNDGNSFFYSMNGSASPYCRFKITTNSNSFWAKHEYDNTADVYIRQIYIRSF